MKNTKLFSVLSLLFVFPLSAFASSFTPIVPSTEVPSDKSGLHLMVGGAGTVWEDAATSLSPTVDIGWTFEGGVIIGYQKGGMNGYSNKDHGFEHDAVYMGYELDNALRLTAGASLGDTTGVSAMPDGLDYNHQYRGANFGVHKVLDNNIMLGIRVHVWEEANHTTSLEIGYKF